MANKLTVMRGLPGSGKTTKARTLGGLVLGSDDYFMCDGWYLYDKGRQGLAHEWNQDRCRKAMEASHAHIIIDNTNTMRWEMEPYFRLARRHKYTVDIIVMEEWDVDLLTTRNSHGVPREAIQAMADRFERG